MGKSTDLWVSLVGVFVVFSCTCLLTQCQETQYSLSKVNCNETELDQCFQNLPFHQGIPSNPQEVDKACRGFNWGMVCFNNWTKTCLSKQDQEKWLQSASGAVRTYKFLCTDKRFQRDFLRHADCYRRISHHWDNCTAKFIDSLKRVNHAKDVLSLCCIRFRYLHCVTDVARKFCSKEATEFVQKVAESLVPGSMKTYVNSTTPIQCNQINERKCTAASSAQSSTKFTSNSPSFAFLHRILAYPTKGFVNSLNVLQNFAFSDISTFLCALEREFNPYSSHHLRKMDEDDEDDTDLDDPNNIQSKIVTSSSSCFATDFPAKAVPYFPTSSSAGGQETCSGYKS